MDIVYILGSGSVWYDNEIRYSLRSIEKNIKDLGKVFIVGEKPSFLKNIIHIPCPDDHNIKWRNGYIKVKKACQDSRLSKEFLLMNDDFFILKKIKAETYPHYYKTYNSAKYNQRIVTVKTTPNTTMHELIKLKKPVLNFAVHCPFRIIKADYLKMPEIDLRNVGFSPRIFYGNYFEVKATLRKDPVMSPPKTEQIIERHIEGETDISIFTHTGKNKHFRGWIHKRFPNPSKYERVEIEVTYRG